MAQNFPDHQEGENRLTNSRGVYFESALPVSSIRILCIPQASLRKLKQSACACRQNET